ncbi:hypothetical protein [Nocardiopsis sp. JB363]|uniref:hypothetical protein n=1 Tax=Nocardiopsis sp. JB363 TaxID=1434837 RepID=UPI00117FC53E|nr:hypothetical protein [Nocardiopsis sp. JB363]
MTVTLWCVAGAVRPSPAPSTRPASAGLVLRDLAQYTADHPPEVRAEFDASPFAAPEQLAAYAMNPGLALAGQALFMAGALLLIPAFVALAHKCVERSPRLAITGALMLLICLVARLYYGGVDQTAFQLVDAMGLEAATEHVLAVYQPLSYGPWRVPVIASSLQYPGGLLLALAAYRAGVFGTGRALLLILWATIWAGALKETDTFYGLTTALALCVAFVPLGRGSCWTACPNLASVAGS